MDAAVQCIDLPSLATYLGFAPQNLFYLVKLRDSLYIDINIPKRGSPGTYRNISIPNNELKGVQRAILRLILEQEKPTHYAFAYVQGRSVVTAAKKICGRQSVLKMDIKDFFPSINLYRVYGLFRSMSFSKKVAYVLARLCTYQDCLCQGAPTSPYLSNLICRHLDKSLSELANTWGLKYLRYSDDIFFYGPQDFRHKVFAQYAIKAIGNCGFSVNARKTRYCAVGTPRFTLGLATHGKQPSLPRKVKRSYRAAFFRASRDLKWARENVNQLSGMAEWYKSVHGYDEIYREYRKILDNVKRVKLHDHYVV